MTSSDWRKYREIDALIMKQQMRLFIFSILLVSVGPVGSTMKQVLFYAGAMHIQVG